MISELEDSNRNYPNLKIQRKYFYSMYFRKKMIIEILRWKKDWRTNQLLTMWVNKHYYKKQYE